MVVRTTSKNDLARREHLPEHKPQFSIPSPSESPKHFDFEPHVVETNLHDPKPQWIVNSKALHFLYKLLSSMYVCVLTIVACLISLSSPWSSSSLWLAETIFSMLMYGIAIVFFIYVYLFVIYPKPVNTFILFLNKKTKWMPRPERFLIEEPVHNGEGAGTFYLRLGALFFGTIGSVLLGCEIYLSFTEHSYHHFTVAKYIMWIIFTYVQMHFLFTNSKITFKKDNRLATFGLMHCVAVNLWTWFSLCLVKAQVKKAKKKKKELAAATTQSSSSSSEESDATAADLVIEAVTVIANETKLEDLYYRMLGMGKLGDVSNFLLTCLVEYSLIGAAVCFIIWKYMGHSHDGGHSENGEGKKKKRVRLECKSVTLGMFMGIILMIGTFVTIGIYMMLYGQGKIYQASLVIGITNLILFIMALLACFFGLWRMRVLQYRLHAHGEVIDEILLIIGLVAEILYCSVGFDLAVDAQKKGLGYENLSIAVFLFRIIQVIVQSTFILIASRLRCFSPENARKQPGKQTITFLLTINITLFVYHTFEGMKAYYGFPDAMENKYFELMNACSPLIVFYRFHSSACFAEIWKHAFTTKHNHHHDAHSAPNSPSTHAHSA
ncbi:unnamed protein product [Caenorhabditis bovis]|uniref:Uncharacterized protein n=1 Tax=Caenorhabditis bovis TaxID=2654633 RepID=A0A8S1EGU2_9PELO|nr:unnamed protein product [Caenorhabditis bovis]